MNGWTRFFLVLLRLVIGWHFLVEGYDKVESLWKGPTTTSKPFSSAFYLRESSGPVSPFFHWIAGDPDQEALDKLTVLAPDSDNPDQADSSRIPATLRKDWEGYVQRYKAKYDLTSVQEGQSEEILAESETKAVLWLLARPDKDGKPFGEREVEKTFNKATYKLKDTPAQRIAIYRDRLQDLHRMQSRDLQLFGKDVYGPRLQTFKAETAAWRNDLLKDLGALLKDPLQEILTSDQKLKGPVPDAPPTALLWWTDRIVSYGVLAVGVCLLLGVLSRLACASGALFLFMFYLAMPAIPGVPEIVKVEGHYFFINKNIVEMMALLALATTASGRWFGLDGLLSFLNPMTYGKAEASAKN